jgi:hypothetical protein
MALVNPIIYFAVGVLNLMKFFVVCYISIGATNGVVSWTPTAAGIYYYQCSVHDGMYGTITVQ